MQTDLTLPVRSAQSGRRRDIRALIEALPQGQLLIPLRHDLENYELGELRPLSENLELVPHMLQNEDGKLFATLFTRADLLSTIEVKLGWKTDDDTLKFCTVPAPIALEMALAVIDEEDVLGLAINPAHDSELVLTRVELSQIVRGEAIPLVGYVDRIGAREDAETLVAEAEPPGFLGAELDAILPEFPEILRYSVQNTFNQETDLEPHWTVKLYARIGTEPRIELLTQRIVSAVKDRLPPPGYIDILVISSDPS